MPNVKKQNGVKMVQSTGTEKFLSFLTGALSQYAQQQQMAQQRKMEMGIRADQVVNEQANMRIALGQLQERNPEMYNQVIEDPIIRNIMDPARADLIKS